MRNSTPTADVSLSPFAEELVMETEDAVVLGKEAEEREKAAIEIEFQCGEISKAERDYLLSILGL